MKTRADLALELGISIGKLNYFLFVLSDRQKYYAFEINKRNGDKRKIYAPNKPLKDIQRKLLLILTPIYEASAPKCVHGFRPKRSPLTNAQCHLAKRVIIKMDFENYFDNISGGMVFRTLTGAPYRLNKDVAYAITNLCTYNGYLPQGSPASPILANMVTRSLDIKLMRKAQSSRSTYTRYADDLTISFSNRNMFEGWIDTKDVAPAVTDSISSLISSKNFVLNGNKTRVRKYFNRQIVGGIIVNNKLPNTPKNYAKETKLLIHICLKYGLKEAEKSYFSANPKNKHSHNNNFDILSLIRGRLEYIKSIKGPYNSIYIDLAKRYSLLNPKYKVFIPTEENKDPKELIVFCEGKTDYKHIDVALKFFKTKGLYTNLKLDLSDKDIGGCSKLLKKIEALKGSDLGRKHVMVFDSDTPEILKIYPPNTMQQVSDNLWVIVIPHPEHIPQDEPFAIEMLYREKDLYFKDKNGRRIYLTKEFNKLSGRHLKENVMTSPKFGDKLIVDDRVYDLSEPPESTSSINLSKDDFTALISDRANRDEVDFSGFRNFLDKILEISRQDV